MARRKSVCVKWTLVLILIIFSSYVYSRPQESTTSSSTGQPIVEPEESTENLIRYNDSKRNISISNIFDSELKVKNNQINYIDLRNVDFSNNNDTRSLVGYNSSIPIKILNVGVRQSRLVNNYHKNINRNFKKSTLNQNNRHRPINNDKQPVIKKFVTKWTDNAKYEDLDLSYETKTSLDSNIEDAYEEYSSTESFIDMTNRFKNHQFTLTNKKIYSNVPYKVQPQYSEETQVYSNNVQIVDERPYPHARPNYVFSTPTPTPIVTNVGYPKPRPQKGQIKPVKSTTRKPIKPTRKKITHNHNNLQNYEVVEVTSVKSRPTYTDRIVIRPEEYNASPYDCPTIFLSLNNTFQGQGKEACPDLNIAVNTNVIHKNVVIESEEDTDSTITDIFGLPFDQSDSDESTNAIDFTESYENQEQTESASIEGLSLTNYNANGVSGGDSIEFGNQASPSTALSTISRPKRPNKKKKDEFGLSSILNFFQPVVKGFGWLVAINPLSFSAITFILTPLIFVVAAISGLATLFSPWAFSNAREASENSSNTPHWQWDDTYKTWYWSSFPDSKKWNIDSPRSNNFEYLIFIWWTKIKEWFKLVEIKYNKTINNSLLLNKTLKSKRRKEKYGHFVLGRK